MHDRILRILCACFVTKPVKPWHGLRHTFGTELASRGVPVHHIQKLIGHKDINTTLLYMHTDRAAMRLAIEKLRPQDGEPTYKEKTLAKHLT